MFLATVRHIITLTPQQHVNNINASINNLTGPSVSNSFILLTRMEDIEGYIYKLTATFPSLRTIPTHTTERPPSAAEREDKQQKTIKTRLKIQADQTIYLRGEKKNVVVSVR